MCLNPHVHFITLIMAYIFIRMHMASTMVYIFIKMHLTSTMAYIFIQMHLALHVPFETMAMVK
jgi:hypothetical protein